MEWTDAVSSPTQPSSVVLVGLTAPQRRRQMFYSQEIGFAFHHFIFNALSIHKNLTHFNDFLTIEFSILLRFGVLQLFLKLFT